MSKMKLMFGMLICLSAFGFDLQAQITENAIWGGGSGNWFGSGANWVCVASGVTSPCTPPNEPPFLGANATIGTVVNGQPINGTVTTDAPFSLNGLTVGSGAQGTLNITSAGAGSQVSDQAVTTVGTQGTLNVTGGGSLYSDSVGLNGVTTVSGGGSVLSGREVYAGGTVQVLNGGRISAIYPEISGNVTVDGAGSSISSGFRSLIIDGGSNVTLTNGGSLSVPANTGYLELDAGATLTFGMTGASGNGVVYGPGVLDGTVDFDFLNGFAPTAGENFTLFDGSQDQFFGVNVTDAAFEVTGLAPGFEYQLVSTNSAFELEALNNGVSLTGTSPAPEPASIFFCFVALLGFAAWSRKPA